MLEFYASRDDILMVLPVPKAKFTYFVTYRYFICSRFTPRDRRTYFFAESMIKGNLIYCPSAVKGI